MRLLGVLLASLLMIGCGSGHRSSDPGAHFGAGFFAPQITQLTPDSSPVNSPPFTMTVNGANFGADALVFWNGNPQSTPFVSGNQLTTTVTDNDLMFGGVAHVYVRTSGLNSNTVDFNVTAE